MSGKSISHSEHDPCPRCKGDGWYHLLRVVDGEEQWPPELMRCEVCANFLEESRLTPDEQQHTIGHIEERKEDTRKEAMVLRFLGKEMLRDPYGFLSIYGHKGAGKSLLLTALVAEFCRAGTRAVYFNASEIVEMTSPGETKEIDGFRLANSYSANKRRLMEVPVLAIDEIDKIRWTQWQIQHIGEIIEWRHRYAETRATLLAMNNPPWKWHNADQVAHIASRLQDGRFRRQWPEEYMHLCPKWIEGGDVPGLLEVTLPDMRPFLRR